MWYQPHICLNCDFLIYLNKVTIIKESTYHFNNRNINKKSYPNNISLHKWKKKNSSQTILTEYKDVKDNILLVFCYWAVY